MRLSGGRRFRDAHAACLSPADDDVTTAQSEFWEPGDGVCSNTEAGRAGGGLGRGKIESAAPTPTPGAERPGLGIGTGRGWSYCFVLIPQLLPAPQSSFVYVVGTAF